MWLQDIRWLAIVRTGFRQAIVDGPVLVDESDVLEPVPLLLGLLQIPLLVEDPVGQVRCDRQEEFVDDGVDIAGVQVRVETGVTARGSFGRGLYHRPKSVDAIDF